MSMRVNRPTYEKMIAEDLAWLERYLSSPPRWPPHAQRIRSEHE